MRDIVLVPTYNRPEYLLLCLERILAADGGSEKEVWVQHDTHQNIPSADLSLTREVVCRFEGKFAYLRYGERLPHGYYGNTFSTMEMYKQACETDARFVYLVEDDVHVGVDFFRWHESVQGSGTYFCSVAWSCRRNPKAVLSDDPLGYIETSCDYASVGVCWRRESLERVAHHACPAYYANPSEYLRKAFPDNPIPGWKWTEQDGLIMRLLLQPGASNVVAWPSRPRCAHVGLHGYHRPHGPRFIGDLDSRATQLRFALSSTESARALARDKFDHPDIDAVPESAEWRTDDLRVTQRLTA